MAFDPLNLLLLAIALIAFLAGAELQIAEIRERGAAILKLMSTELLLSFVGVAVTIALLRSQLPVLATAPTAEVIAFTPVSMLGSGIGLKKGECSDGSVVPFALASATTSVPMPSPGITTCRVRLRSLRMLSRIIHKLMVLLSRPVE